jgi:subtilisin family serine protease
MTYRSASTIKADLARRVFDATGRGIVVAVLDSGVDATHPHFRRHRNLEIPAGLSHADFTSHDENAASALIDEFGHGTYIAGIIAGEASDVWAAEMSFRDDGDSIYEAIEVPHIAGIAPECTILSLKVLGANGQSEVSTVIRALEWIQQLNDGGLRIHVVNLGLGYAYDAARFACGRSPICVAVERLVRAGVVVVVCSGNSGYGNQMSLTGSGGRGGLEVSINDPGNAQLAITVGSTDRELPQVYGVSYFSSKGPTLDGRLKPDLVAPGERIVSPFTGSRLANLRDKGMAEGVMYGADSGTSIAAAHVAGAAAALLSARRELIGQPEAVKAVLMTSATDLRRSQFFQGRGVVDVLQAMQEAVPRGDVTTVEPRVSVVPTPARDERTAAPPAPAGSSVPAPPEPRALRVMYSYSHKDDVYREELDMALAALRREGLIEVWQDREDLLPGSEFDKDIARALVESDVVLLLISRAYIASEYAWCKEMTVAVRQHDEGHSVVVPVIVRRADWHSSPFGKLTALPRDGRPITEWDNQDAAWADVAEGVRRLVTARRAT